MSTDLVHWEQLPPALVPTPGGYDADGCFSGSITISPRTGLPVLFYTGARLRGNQEVRALHAWPQHPLHHPCRLSAPYVPSNCLSVML